MSWTPTTVTVLDGNAASKTFIAYTDGTNFSFAHPLLDSTGAIINPATSTNQTTANTALAAIQAAVSGVLTSGGANTYHNGALSNTVTSVKASAGQIFSIDFTNLGASAAFVQIFDLLTGGVTLGTTPPKKSFWVPPGGNCFRPYQYGIAHATGISIAATTTESGSSAPATALIANIDYF